MKKTGRVFLIVLDSCGIGEAPDAADFKDEGCSTVRAISSSDNFSIKTLADLGYTFIDGLSFLPKGTLRSTVARLRELSCGKDTTTGHWEIAGIVSEKPMPVFPDGFPDGFIKEFSEKTGRGVLCNKPCSGTQVIADYGEEHIKTGDLICYTSADSVFQIAAHESIVAPEQLYDYCRTARAMLKGELGVGRVIARPFNGEYPFTRTPRRHDFSLEPPRDTVLDKLSKNGYDVIGIGKINDIFAGKGITEHVYTENNGDGMAVTLEYQKKDFNGLCFVNLVDFDMIYGHRRDVDGYAKAFSEFDSWLSSFVDGMRDDDIVMVTADHGCDPSFSGTDHTREYVPFLMYGKTVEPKNLGTLDGFNVIAGILEDIFLK